MRVVRCASHTSRLVYAPRRGQSPDRRPRGPGYRQRTGSGRGSGPGRGRRPVAGAGRRRPDRPRVGRGRVTVALTPCRRRSSACGCSRGRRKTRVLEPAEAEVTLDGRSPPPSSSRRGSRCARLSWSSSTAATGTGRCARSRRAGSAASTPRAPPSGSPWARSRRCAATAPRPGRARPLETGPDELRALIDEIVGPGERTGGDDYLEFKLAGPTTRASCWTRSTPTSARSPRSCRSAPAVPTPAWPRPRYGRAARHRSAGSRSTRPPLRQRLDRRRPARLDTAVLKALLAEAWTTGHDFGRRLGDAAPAARRGAARAAAGRRRGAGRAGHLDGDPRPLAGQRLHAARRRAAELPGSGRRDAVARPCRGSRPRRAPGRCCASGCCARTRAPPAGLGRARGLEHGPGPLRLGVVQEVGVDADALVVLNFNALQVQRGQPRRDLEVGLGMVDERAGQMERDVRPADRRDHPPQQPAVVPAAAGQGRPASCRRHPHARARRAARRRAAAARVPRPRPRAQRSVATARASSPIWRCCAPSADDHRCRG